MVEKIKERLKELKMEYLNKAEEYEKVGFPQLASYSRTEAVAIEMALIEIADLERKEV